MNKKVRREWEV